MVAARVCKRSPPPTRIGRCSTRPSGPGLVGSPSGGPSAVSASPGMLPPQLGEARFLDGLTVLLGLRLLRNLHNASLARGALVWSQLAGRVCFRFGFCGVRNLERRAGEIRILWL